MKKSLLALAALASVAGAASAQSSVTLSGSVDLGLVRAPFGENGVPGDTSWKMQNAASSRTAINLAGVEDLGGGLKAFFNLNHRFNANDGTQRDPNFWRQSWVGLMGGFGEVRLGRMLVPLQDLNGQYEAWDGGDTVGTVHTGGMKAAVRENSMVYYKSPSFGGVQIQASVAETNANAVGVVDPKRPIGVGAKFTTGPVSVALAYDRTTADIKTIGLYGSYDFGVAKLMGQFERGNIVTDGDKGKRASLSVTVPVGAAVLKAGYGRYGIGLDTHKYGIGADYYLSKRTYFYSDLGKTGGDGASKTGGYATDVNNLNTKVAFDIGIRHKF